MFALNAMVHVKHINDEPTRALVVHQPMDDESVGHTSKAQIIEIRFYELFKPKWSLYKMIFD